MPGLREPASFVCSRYLARLLACAVPLAAAAIPAVAQVAPPDIPPDIVLISIDSLRNDHLGCSGYRAPTSPTIDRLAAAGARFETAISTTSWTLPAHAALFTGLYDSTHGLVDNGLRLSDDHVTLAESLRTAGYQTAGFYGGPYLHPTFGLAQGFDKYQTCMTTLPDTLSGAAARKESNADTGAAHGDVTGPRTVAEITRWLAKADKRPMFLFVHLWDVHYDYLAPQRYVNMFDPGYQGTLTGRGVMKNPAVNASMPARDLRHLVALYDAEIRLTDDTLADLLRLLERRRGRMSNTLLVVTSDHGEEFFEHGSKGHGHSLFDEVVHVPLIVSWPGHIRAGRVVPDQVRLIDVMPTLLAAARVPVVPQMQGRSLIPLLRGKSLPPEPALSELLVDNFEMRSLRAQDFKYISQGPGLDSGGFDLVADPAERRPIGPDFQRVRLGLRQLDHLLEAARSFRVLLARSPRAAEPDEETLEQLRSLGYIGDTGSGASSDPPQ